MSTPDLVMLLFAESQLCKMHFKDQHALILPGKAMFLKSECYRPSKGSAVARNAGSAIFVTPIDDC